MMVDMRCLDHWRSWLESFCQMNQVWTRTLDLHPYIRWSWLALFCQMNRQEWDDMRRSVRWITRTTMTRLCQFLPSKHDDVVLTNFRHLTPKLGSKTQIWAISDQIWVFEPNFDRLAGSKDPLLSISIESSQQPSSIRQIKIFSWSLPFFENRVKFVQCSKKGRDQLKIFMCPIDGAYRDDSKNTPFKWSLEPASGSKLGSNA